MTKTHVRRNVNEGHNVQNCKDLKEVMLSGGGINSVRVALVDAGSEGKCVIPQIKLARVNSLINFQYSGQGVIAWKAFEFRQGKLISQS